MDLLHILQTNVSPTIGLSLLFVVLTFIYRRKRSSSARLPPGPTPIPVLGNMLQMDLKQPYKFYSEISKKYGPVFTVWMASKPVVVISGYQAIKEALVNQGEVFNGRSNPAISKNMLHGYGVGSSNGHRWTELRGFALRSLNNFGIGCRSLEDRVQEEARSLVDAFSKCGDSIVNPKDLLYPSIINLFCSIILGQRFEHNHPTFQLIHKLVAVYFEMTKSLIFTLYNMFPRVVGCFPGKHREVLKGFDEFKCLLREEGDRRLEDLDTSNPQDFSEAFLVKMLEEKDRPGTEYHYDNFAACVWDLFGAGTETQASTLAHALLLMIAHPHIQEKVQKEIDEVVGSSRVPMFDDRPNMPYTDAVIHEIQRSMNLAPFAVPHKVISDTEFYNYHLPEGIVVLPLLSSVLSDPDLFKNPDEFDPENFLDEDGRFKKSDGFIAFGMGKRGCLGDGMGIPRLVLFLFFTTVLQRLTFSGTKPPEEIDTSTDNYSVGQLARPYNCYVKLRNMESS